MERGPSLSGTGTLRSEEEVRSWPGLSQVGTPASSSSLPVGAVTPLGPGQGAHSYLVGARLEAVSIRGLATAKDEGVLAGPQCQLSSIAPSPLHPTRLGMATPSGRREFDMSSLPPIPEPSPCTLLFGTHRNRSRSLQSSVDSLAWKHRDCFELGPGPPQPKGQRDRRDEQRGTRTREEAHSRARVRRRSCLPRLQVSEPEPCPLGAHPFHMALA